MSENSSITVDQPERRNDNNQRQIGGNQIANPNPPALPSSYARRILVIQNQTDIVSALSAISRAFGQGIYILAGRGYVSQATLVALPSLQRFNTIGVRQIHYLSGWFHPTMHTAGLVALSSSRPNGILHVSLSSVQQSVAIATRLIAYGSIEVYVTIVCGPGSMVQPAPGDPLRVNVPAPTNGIYLIPGGIVKDVSFKKLLTVIKLIFPAS